MKKTMKVVILAAFLIAIGVSFFIGRQTERQEYLDNRLQINTLRVRKKILQSSNGKIRQKTP